MSLQKLGLGQLKVLVLSDDEIAGQSQPVFVASQCSSDRNKTPSNCQINVHRTGQSLSSCRRKSDGVVISLLFKIRTIKYGQFHTVDVSFIKVDVWMQACRRDYALTEGSDTVVDLRLSAEDPVVTNSNAFETSGMNRRG